MNQGITLEQRQSLNLTPQMHQSIKILQMDLIELNKWLEKASQDNPVLEVELNQISEKEKEFDNREYEDKDNLKEHLNNKIELDDWQDRESLFSYYPGGKFSNKEKLLLNNYGENLQYAVLQSTNLHEHLLLNLKMLIDNDVDFKIGEYLIGNINQNGYLVVSCREVSKDLNIAERKVKKVLAIIQSCSFPGLGARSLKECLLLQLNNLKIENKQIIKKLIINYLDELSKKNFNKICKKLYLSNYDIQNLLDIIVKNFEPKPGRMFSQDNEAFFLIPDIIVKKVDDSYEIRENRNYFPSIKINSHYKNILLEENTKDRNNRESLLNEKGSEYRNTLQYLKKNLNSARWIIRCVEQRKKTVLTISRFIIDYQKDFLEKGISYLKPLSMKEAANVLELHESTISRAINGKKIQLPRGFYDMKYFFSKGLPQEKIEPISNEKIKNIIKAYIETEDCYFPYTDMQIAYLLKTKNNIQIARRTVAKYRKLLEIPSAKIRRRYREKINYKQINTGRNKT
jgi:RNA polymerase sigma-54 factor